MGPVDELVPTVFGLLLTPTRPDVVESIPAGLVASWVADRVPVAGPRPTGVCALSIPQVRTASPCPTDVDTPPSPTHRS